MTPESALADLLARLGGANGAAILVNDEELSQWPPAAVAAMKSQKLLAKARPANSVVCPGCEQACLMPVHTPPRGGGRGRVESFIVCDKRDDINRVPVSTGHLQQWRCDMASVAAFLATHLGLRRNDQRHAEDGVLRIGVASGAKRTQMLCLRSHGDLAVVAASNTMPLAELVGYRDGGYHVDDAAIRRLVDAATTADPRYTPSTAKRDARKLDTQAMYESWRKAYRALRRKRPNESDVWYSRQIAKQPVGARRSAETIRRNMKT